MQDQIIKSCANTFSKGEIELIKKAMNLLLDEVIKLYVPDGNPEIWLIKIKELKS